MITETKTAHTSEVVDSIPAQNALTVMEDGSVRAAEPVTAVSMDVLKNMGFITPLATPEQLRAAFAYKQQMFAAILDPRDYLYTVTYKDGKKTRQNVYADFDEAQALCDKFQHLNAIINAKPKKSGIVKLARALGITASRKLTGGLPGEPNAMYAYVEYEAVHAGTGQSEIGVGWCDKGERGGSISTHDVITTADTRAYNRAVLRLSGFGDVSAEEIIAGNLDDGLPDEVPRTAKQKEIEPLPDLNNDEVLAASRAWAEAIVKRKDKSGESYAPGAQQDTRAAREMRAQARRGDVRAAQRLGVFGLYWTGTASDGLSSMPFSVALPPVTPQGISNAAAAAESSTNGKSKEADKGWDLSGNGSDKDDEGLPADLPDVVDPPKSSLGIPQPHPGSDTITTKQAKNVSSLLKEIFASTDEMKAWMREQCHVDSSINIRLNQYEIIIRELQNIADLKKEKSKNG